MATMKAQKPDLERIREMSLYEAFRSSNDVMFYCDQDSNIIEVNPAFLRLYGYRREEVIGRNPRFLRSDHSTAELYKRMWEGMLDPVRGFWRGQIINKAKDGREIPMLLSITSIRDVDGRVVGFMAIGMDMTESLSLKTRVAQSEALANIGEMAAVVAHEIRNPLGSVVIAANQLASDTLSAGEKGMVMKLLRSESKRLSDVLAGFLAYARPPSLRLARVDLNALVTEVLAIAQSNRELIRHTRVSVSLNPGLRPCPMDSEQIRQVVWNIVVNALQAMDGYGKLTVTTGREPGWVFFRVRDTGPGISEAVLPEILKPFFTTKRQGTGLGLATADRIVKAHGGVIGVESRPADGAAFTVRLPWAEG
ncbi:MAG: PAS domain S-box protein [Elusimicrobia bacterium]|nr:PAS domain S-box protein [Elusimicrobiota bacterium]